MPDSRLSEWRTTRGTRGLVTTLDDSTGSVGESSAPTRKLSVQPRSVSQCVASATITHVSGIATTSLRSGSRHAFCSISASTSSPSRNRITISATIARSCTKPERGSISSTPRPPSPSRKPGEHEDRGQRQERAVGEPGRERADHQQPAEDERRDVEARRRRARSRARVHTGGLTSPCASPCWGSPPPGRTPTAPARAISSRRRADRAARLRARRVRQAARATSTTWTSTRSSSATCTPTTSSTSCRSRPACATRASSRSRPRPERG